MPCHRLGDSGIRINEDACAELPHAILARLTEQVLESGSKLLKHSTKFSSIPLSSP